MSGQHEVVMLQPKGAAFPQANGYQPGMTLRDYFAAAAMTGLLANSQPDYNTGTESVSRLAYHYADAMLAARDAKQGGR